MVQKERALTLCLACPEMAALGFTPSRPSPRARHMLSHPPAFNDARSPADHQPSFGQSETGHRRAPSPRTRPHQSTSTLAFSNPESLSHFLYLSITTPWPLASLGSTILQTSQTPPTNATWHRKPISLISQSDVRYRGTLAGIDPAASTIQLSNGASCRVQECAISDGARVSVLNGDRIAAVSVWPSGRHAFS